MEVESLGVDPTYCIIHAVVEGLVLGEETTGTIRGVGELGAVDEVIHRGTSSSSSCSDSSSRRVPVREVKVPLAVVTVALKDKKKMFVKRLTAVWPCLVNPYCCKKLSFQSGYIRGYTLFLLL